MLSPAAELAYHTVCCSALNAEEMNREKGIDMLRNAMKRTVNTLTASTKDSDLDAKVSLFACRCLTVAAQFESCSGVLTMWTFFKFLAKKI